MPFVIQIKEQKIQFAAVFQPIIDLLSHEVAAMEVLSRPSGRSSIESTLRLISSEGKSREFTLALLKEILTESRLLPKGVRYLSINITMDHMCSPSLGCDLEKLVATLHERQIALVVELPEREPYPRPNDVEGQTLISNIKKLKDRGILIAIDDYGKGFNVGEAIVSRLMPDILKIDKNVVQRPNENKDVWASLESITDSKQISIVAEGIEHVKDLDFVKSTGIRLCQGFYFGRPASL